jgi:uncharacterized surface protein with fasciclin (FAS1) repeats
MLRVVASGTLLACALPRAASAQETDVMATVSSVASFSTLTRLLQDAGLTMTLRGPGPYTLLAPTDAAFAALPADTLDALRRNKARLRSILLTHILPGKLSAADLTARAATGVKTAEGSTLTIMPMGASLMIGRSHVTAADRLASNGVVHTIDAVLLPPRP